MKNPVLKDVNLYATMHEMKWNVAPTDIVLSGTLREKAKRMSLRRELNAKLIK